MLSNKFKTHHNGIVLALQYLKLKRKSHESTQEWMARLQTKAVEFDYSEHHRRLNKQFLHGIDGDVMLCEILSEV